MSLNGSDHLTGCRQIEAPFWQQFEQEREGCWHYLSSAPGIGTRADYLVPRDEGGKAGPDQVFMFWAARLIY